MKKKVLIVDNHPLVLKFITDVLEKEDLEVSTAHDGLSALEVLETNVPDIIVTDLVMPNIDGKKLCQIIRGTPKLKDVFLIILSAIAAERDFNWCELGADVYIAKGPLKETAKHILTAIEQSDQKPSQTAAKEIIGLEYVTSRAVTKELLSDKRHFEVILESMSEGIVEITREAKVVYANPAALSMIGRAERELLAFDFTDLFFGKDRATIKVMLDEIQKEPQPILMNSPVILNNKEVEIKVRALDESQQKIIIILNDVTEQKRREAQLQQAQKMEAIGTLAAGIAHDFNNLLMGIQGYASLMLLHQDSDYPYYDMLKGIEKQVQRGAKLTKQLIGYSRQGRYEVRPIDLNRLIEETSDTFGRTKKEITIHRNLSPDLFTIEADKSQIEQVLLNLYVNAADAMPDGGDLYLETVNTTHEDIKDGAYDPKPGNYILLSVTDTGVGMDSKTQSRIFEPFFTTKEMGTGSGLGLASAYGIITGHGGYIDVSSKEDHGTIFKIFLPGRKGENKEPQRGGRKRTGVVKGNETILFVDDEDMIREVGQEMLEVQGYHVLTASDGREAIETYEENMNTIDIVLLDMVMPHMGGDRAYDRLKEINPHVKVLLSSGYSIDGEAGEILERGCNGFIQKPFNINELSSKIKQILDE
ncbi:MAG: response regulator [Thermodesulfobacteriota bacterium]|nr:response regulator [Thermodesulfobacteriota bacterium]